MRACLAVALVLVVGCPPPPSTTATAPTRVSSVVRKDVDVKNMNNLTQIGLAYQLAQLNGPVKEPADLILQLDGHREMLRSPRDRQPYEIVWRVDPGKISEGSSSVLLAWEKTADEEGKRWVLYANCGTVAKLEEHDFEKTPKAKPNS
jgi:hypothetical protein